MLTLDGGDCCPHDECSQCFILVAAGSQGSKEDGHPDVSLRPAIAMSLGIRRSKAMAACAALIANAQHGCRLLSAG